MNPILLKPKGDDISQVVVCGKPFADYRVKEYYDEFVPGPGIQIVKEHVDFMKRRYDFVVMEGAGFLSSIKYGAEFVGEKIPRQRVLVPAVIAHDTGIDRPYNPFFRAALGNVEPEPRRRHVRKTRNVEHNAAFAVVADNKADAVAK